MKANEKKGLIILVIVSIVIIGILVMVVNSKNKNNDNIEGGKGQTSDNVQQANQYTKVEENGTITNISQKVNESKEMEGFSISNVSLKEANGETTLSARITNNTKNTQNSFFGKVILLDSANNEIGRIPVRVSETKPGEAIEIEASITESYVNAYDFKLEK